jgi:TolA-binding protein
MKNTLLFIAMLAITSSMAAQTTNTVIEKDGKLYVQTTTINQVEASSDLVSQKIDKLNEEKAKLEASIKQIDGSITELQKMFYELQRKEKKLKKEDAKGQ